MQETIGSCCASVECGLTCPSILRLRSAPIERLEYDERAEVTTCLASLAGVECVIKSLFDECETLGEEALLLEAPGRKIWEDALEFLIALDPSEELWRLPASEVPEDREFRVSLQVECCDLRKWQWLGSWLYVKTFLQGAGVRVCDSEFGLAGAFEGSSEAVELCPGIARQAVIVRRHRCDLMRAAGQDHLRLPAAAGIVVVEAHHDYVAGVYESVDSDDSIVGMGLDVLAETARSAGNDGERPVILVMPVCNPGLTLESEMMKSLPGVAMVGAGRGKGRAGTTIRVKRNNVFTPMRVAMAAPLVNAFYLGPNLPLSTFEATCGFSAPVRVTGTLQDRPMSVWMGPLPARPVTWKHVLFPLDQYCGPLSLFAFTSDRRRIVPAGGAPRPASVFADAWGYERLVPPDVFAMGVYMNKDDEFERGSKGPRRVKVRTARSLFRDVVYCRMLDSICQDDATRAPSAEVDPREDWRHAARPGHRVSGEMVEAPLTMAALDRTKIPLSSWQLLMFRRLVTLIAHAEADALVAGDINEVARPAAARRGVPRS
jgi:hypothetical protein